LQRLRDLGGGGGQPCGGEIRLPLREAPVRRTRTRALRPDLFPVPVQDGEWLVVVDVPLLLETVSDEAELRNEVWSRVLGSAGFQAPLAMAFVRVPCFSPRDGRCERASEFCFL
jgi:hypothetical protein